MTIWVEHVDTDQRDDDVMSSNVERFYDESTTAMFE